MAKKCPQCNSYNLFLNAAGTTGKYECKDCGYTGVLVIEEEEE